MCRTLSRSIWVAVAVVGVALFGCASQEKRGSGTATTPQEKARQEQLERMAAEDAARAGVQDGAEPQPRREAKPIERRNTGQRVIDQPRVR